MNIYLPEERFVEQVPGDVFNDGSVAGEDGLGIDNLKKLKNKHIISKIVIKRRPSFTCLK
jgi:hypothetical protein